jgi:hypothetical protein
MSSVSGSAGSSSTHRIGGPIGTIDPAFTNMGSRSIGHETEAEPREAVPIASNPASAPTWTGIHDPGGSVTFAVVCPALATG